MSEIGRFRARGLSPKELERLAEELRGKAGAELDQAGERGAQAVRATLEAARTETEPVAFDELSAYVDATLPDVEREAFEVRLADDPLLQTEVEDLRVLRAALEAERLAATRVRPFPRRALVWSSLAAAAAALIAFWLYREPRNDFPPRPQDIHVRGSGTPEPAVARLRLRDGAGEVVLRADGSVTGIGLGPDLQRAATEALQAGRLPRHEGLDALRGNAGVLMGASDDPTTFAPLHPVGTFVREDKPLFQWRPHSGARAYVVGIYDEQLEKVAESQELTATEWRPSSALRRGVVYLWQVTALTRQGRVVTPAPPAPQSRFSLLSEAAAHALDARLESAGSSHLAGALVLAQAGLVDEAEAALRALRDENPDSNEVQRLLDQVRRHVPRGDAP